MFIKYKFVHNNGEVKNFLYDGLAFRKFINSGVSGFLSEYHNGKLMYTRIVINSVVFAE